MGVPKGKTSKANTPSIMAAGALSPPIISKAILIIFLPNNWCLLAHQTIANAKFPDKPLF